MKKAIAIVDLQFGSTGKGLIAGYIAKRWCPDTVVCAFAPNAGHTYIDHNGYKMIHRMVPNGVVSANLTNVLLGPGAVVDPEVFLQEWNDFKTGPYGNNQLASRAQVYIHENAAVVYPHHQRDEAKSLVSIGSTMKGTSEAMIDRMRRRVDPLWGPVASGCKQLADYVIRDPDYQDIIRKSKKILIEGAQGYSLSMYHGFYPYVTARDTTTVQLLADVGVPWNILGAVVGTLRTYPIRVANRFNEAGEMVGTSGPCYYDQRELQWSELGMDPELTTVTKLPRRIFTFSEQQIREAIQINGVTHLFANFMNYIQPPEARAVFMNRLQKLCEGYGANLTWLGHGPQDDHVVKRGDAPWGDGSI
jgi:adenylosuccinate synthase